MSLSLVDGLYDGFLTIRKTLNVCSVPSTLFLEKRVIICYQIFSLQDYKGTFALNSYLVAVFLNCAVLYLPVGDYEKKLVWTTHANCGRGERGWHGRWMCANKLIKQDFRLFDD